MPSPARVEEMLPSLEQAVAELSTLAEAVRTGEPLDRPGTVAALEECGAELDRLRAVLDHAAAWHTAWARILAGMAGSYGPDGAAPPAVPDRGSRMSVTV
ncbi:MAG TPA: hypothetical protein VN428_01490 [Bryobacteraceae bacterium]|nr:hypothetical protein [Bryobacteraceae bacterium]